MPDMDKPEHKRPAGRPRIENPASMTLPRVRVTPEKLDAYKRAAEASGASFSQWLRNSLDKAVNR